MNTRKLTSIDLPLMRTGYSTVIAAFVVLTWMACGSASMISAAEFLWDASNPELKTSGELVAGGFSPLFDGQSLEHWNLGAGHEGHWVVRDGVIDYDGKSEQPKPLEKNLWTRDDFGDVEFYVEWRFPRPPEKKPQPIVLFNGDFLLDDAGKRITRPGLDAGDSGILFRGILDCQANIWCQELGSGEINGYRTNKSLSQQLRRSCIPIAKADRPIGEWNGFLITLRDERMTVVLNAQKVLQSEPLPGLPRRGPIGLQHHGDPVQFRNVWVKKIDDK